jgi:hypothetical protein
MIFGDIPIDIIKTPVAHLYIDLALKYQGQKLHKGRNNGRARATLKKCKPAITYNPSGYMPVRRFPPLILGLAYPLQDDEEAMTKRIYEKGQYAPHQIIHVQRHKVRAGKDTMDVWL